MGASRSQEGGSSADAQVEAALLREFVRTHRFDLWAVPPVAAILAVVVADWTSPLASGLWWAVIVGLMLVGERVHRRFLAEVDGPVALDVAAWRARFLWLRVVTSAAWASIVLVAWPGADDGARSFLLVVLASTVALRGATSAAHATAQMLQTVPPMAAILLLCATGGSLTFWGLGLAGIAFAGFVLRIGNHATTRLRQTLQLQADLIAAKEAADAANGAKTAFLATLSHEIRTPMTGILGLTRVLLDTPLTTRQRDYLETVHDSGESLLALLDDVLDLSKVEAGRLDFETEPFRPREVVEGVLRLMAGRAAEKGLELSADIDPTVPDALAGDAMRLRQVLVNLVGNALKFTETGGVRISLATTAAGDGAIDLRATVSDTGIGIPEEAQDRLFEAFSQADAGVARRFGGTGLGLALSRTLVRAMGGDMGFTSQPGQGTDFWFTVRLPLAEADAAGLGDPAEAAGDLPSLSLLVAEDVAANRKVLSAFLRAKGHRVTLVEDGEAAVEAVAAGGFDLVLMDMFMPGLDGLEATQRIRALPDPRAASIPIIATTANALASDAARCRAAGMNGFVSKPILPEKLYAELASVWAASGGRPQESRAEGAIRPVISPAEDLPELDADNLKALDGLLPPAEVEELLRLARETVADTVDEIVAGWEAGDMDRVRRGAHTLRGTAGNVGLARLSGLAQSINVALRADDKDQLERLVARLPDAAASSVASLSAWSPPADPPRAVA